MKVQDVMQTSSIWVEDTLPVKSLARIIFTANLSGFPVVHNKKLVGFVTEEDVFSNMYSLKDNKLRDEKVVAALLDKPVKDLMIKNPISVTPETKLVDAQLLMYKHNFTRLPVVDKKGNIVGTIARGDVFGHILKNEIPTLEQGQYASFVLSSFDQMTDWPQRFDFEFPTLFRIFRRDNIEKILDLGVWTGEYSIGLAKEGMDVTGVDHTPSLIAFANSKKEKLPEKIKKKISFIQSDYKNLEKQLPAGSFESVICMGGSLPYLPIAPEVLLKSAHTLLKKKGVLVLQLVNLERVMEQRKRFLYFRIKKSEVPSEKEELNVEYFDQKDENTLIQNIVTFTSDGKRWIYRGINSIDVKYIKNNQVEDMVKKAGFKDVTITGNKGEEEGQYGPMSIVKPFDPLTSEWMTVFAYK